MMDRQVYDLPIACGFFELFGNYIAGVAPVLRQFIAGLGKFEIFVKPLT